MIPDSIQLEVVTPERQLLSQSVDAVQVPGANGELGILPGHAPLMTELGIGALTYRHGQETGHLTIIRGFAEVLPGRVSVLAEIAERAKEIDVQRAKAARERAEKRLASGSSANIDWARAAAALQRSLIRLHVATRGVAAPSVPHEGRHLHPPD